MRVWTNPCPMIPQPKMTLYELAVSIYDQYVYNEGSVDDSAIQTDAIPALTAWLFGAFYNTIPTDDVNQKAIVSEFITQFMYNFLNREICSDKPDIFKSKLYYGLSKNKYYLLNTTKDYFDIANASINITSESTDVITGSGSKNSKTTGSNQHNTKSNTTSSGSNINNGSSITDMTSSTENETAGSTNNESTNNSNTTNNSRVVNSDYPQSTVDATTVGNPDLQTWTYASGSQDSNSNVNTTSNGTSKTSTNGTANGTATGKNTTTTNDTTNTTQDDETVVTGTDNNTVDVTESNDNQSDVKHNSSTDNYTMLDKLLKILDYMSSNPYAPIYEVINRMNDYFISMYVDEDRDGWIDPTVNLLKYLEV